MARIRFKQMLIAAFFALALHSCATIEVKSIYSQKYYPGVQEEEPFQSIILYLKPFDQEKFQLDSLQFGEEIFAIPGNDTTLKMRVPITTKTKSAVLFYSKKNTSKTLQLDSITQLESLYLP